MTTIVLTFEDDDDAKRFKRWVDKAQDQEGTVPPLYSGLACSAVKRATVTTDPPDPPESEKQEQDLPGRFVQTTELLKTLDLRPEQAIPSGTKPGTAKALAEMDPIKPKLTLATLKHNQIVRYRIGKVGVWRSWKIGHVYLTKTWRTIMIQQEIPEFKLEDWDPKTKCFNLRDRVCNLITWSLEIEGLEG